MLLCFMIFDMSILHQIHRKQWLKILAYNSNNWWNCDGYYRMSEAHPTYNWGPLCGMIEYGTSLVDRILQDGAPSRARVQLIYVCG